jgi:alkylated DNA repair protein alkB family protein 1
MWREFASISGTCSAGAADERRPRLEADRGHEAMRCGDQRQRPKPASACGHDAYRAAERRWRQSSANPAIIDFDRGEDGRVFSVPVPAGAPAWLQGARVFGVRGVDGFRFVRCPFSAAEELRWSRAALCDWAEPPNESNLQAHYGRVAGLFASHLRGRPSLLSKLSWVTLGYHYQWTSRQYEARRRSVFPAELAALASDLARAAGFRLRAEAAIVNYYAAKSTMGAHKP